MCGLVGAWLPGKLSVLIQILIIISVPSNLNWKFYNKHIHPGELTPYRIRQGTQDVKSFSTEASMQSFADRNLLRSIVAKLRA